MSDPPTTPDTFVWQSGDFVEPPHKQPPFNGVEIEAIPTYDDDGQLVSIAITVKDFTNDKEGAKVDHTFEPVRNGDTFALEPSGDFTVSGPLDLRLTAALPDAVVVFVDIFYGLAEQQHHADGGILAIPLTGPPSASETSPDGEATASPPEVESSDPADSPMDSSDEQE